MDDHAPWLPLLAGRFVVLDGPDGSGKSTHARRLADCCRSAGVRVCLVREPGGTHVSERIRQLLLDHDCHDMTPICEMLLYMASRAELVHRVIRPALARGELVIADRYVSSTIAYQGAGAGVPEQAIRDVARIATGGLEPDLVIVLDVDDTVASARLGPSRDRIEARAPAVRERVRRSFLDQAAADPARHLVISANADIDRVWSALCDGLRRFVAQQWGGSSASAP